MVNATVLALRLSVSHLFKKQCFICHRAIRKGAGFTYHHKWYEPNEAYYKHYDTQLQYYQVLVQQIRENPDRFLLLCNAHHQALERLKRYKPENLERLITAVKMTDTSKDKPT